jgi:hypothetical protein
MTFYASVLGEVFIVFVFVFFIWLNVLLEAIGQHNNTLVGRRLLLTSAGLVINAFAVAGVMITRAYELSVGHWPYVAYVSAFFAMLGVAGFLWIISASLGGSTRMLKFFILTSAAWLVYCLFTNF